MDVLFPPGPQKSLLLGDAPHFKDDPLNYMLRSARTYGDLVHFRFGPSHAYLLTNPRDAHNVLVEHFDQFIEKPSLFRALYSAMGHDLFAPKDQLTKSTLRRGVFKQSWLDAFVEGAAQQSAQALDNWQGGDPLTLLKPLTLQLVAKTLFGSFDDQRMEMVEQLDQAISAERNEQRFQSPLTLPDWSPTARNRQRQRANRELNQLVQQMIADLRTGGRFGLLTCLLHAADSQEWAVEELLALFRAGHRAAANTLAWAWTLLAQNSDAADSLQAEVETVLGGRTPSADDLPNLVYTEMVLKETLRLHPPVWLISRQAKRETRLGDYFVPAGSTIFISPYIIQHSQRYFTSPETFLPERFGEAMARRGTNYAYMPFGAGTYAEVERDYAMTLAKLVLALSAQRFRLTAAALPVDPQAAAPGVALYPQPLNVAAVV